ncbi:hypothetical protein ACF068_04955 [Streptomyces sp. NPDC016309]|uniref:hypothetical protein n=1 Tax=Streptomyces sp. NPDC016309 TaxID=3364965 RepID=UPI0036FCD18F
MTVDPAGGDGGTAAHEARLRADAEVLTGTARRLLERAAALEGRPGVPDWCVPTLRRQAECCRAAAADLAEAAAVLGRHAARAVDGSPAVAGRVP